MAIGRVCVGEPSPNIQSRSFSAPCILGVGGAADLRGLSSARQLQAGSDQQPASTHAISKTLQINRERRRREERPGRTAEHNKQKEELGGEGSR